MFLLAFFMTLFTFKG